MNYNKVISIIVAYNSIKDIETLLVKILTGTMPQYKTIVIDNSSSFVQKDMCALIQLKKYEKLNIEYIAMEENVGSAKGFAIGMEKAFHYGADWLWLHDQDGFPEKNCLQHLLMNMDSNIPIIVAPIVKDFDMVEVKNFRCKINLFYNATGIFIEKNMMEIDCAGTAGILISKALVEKIGFYDGEHFFVGWEDFEYCFRAKINKAEILAVMDAVYFHPNLDKKYRRNHSPYKKYIRMRFQKCIPPFFGCLKEGFSYRDKKNIYAYMYLLKKYVPSFLFSLILLYAVFRVLLSSFFSKKINVAETLNEYKKNLFELYK